MCLSSAIAKMVMDILIAESQLLWRNTTISLKIAIFCRENAKNSKISPFLKQPKQPFCLRDSQKPGTMPKHSLAGDDLGVLAKKLRVAEERVAEQKRLIEEKKEAQALCAARAAAAAARVSREEEEAEAVRLKEEKERAVLLAALGKAEAEAERLERAALLGVDLTKTNQMYASKTKRYEAASYVEGLVHPLLCGTLSPAGASSKTLLAETLSARGDEWRTVYKTLEGLIENYVDKMNHGRGSVMIEEKTMYTIFVRVDETGVIHYRCIYNGYCPSDDDDDDSDCYDYFSGPEYVFFDVDMFGDVKDAICGGKYWEAASKIDKEANWSDWVAV